MDSIVIGDVTAGDLVFLGSAVLTALVVSFVVRVISRLVKRRLRREDANSMRAPSN